MKNKSLKIILLSALSATILFANSCKKKEVAKKDPVITWANPADILAGSSLSPVQLNASADVAGAFSYTPAQGAAMAAGAGQSLKVDFTPTDASKYNSVSKTVKINVIPGIGETYQGGTVAYIYQVGDPGYVAGEIHGIIAAASDQTSTIQWYNGANTVTGATSVNLGTGNDNTTTIVASQGTGNYAAKLCSDLVLNSYSDWYLPSKAELNKLYLNMTAIGNFSAGGYYWSSSEDDFEHAWCQFFSAGQQYNSYKVLTLSVRAIRSF